ncbi:unnamed protein product [Mytilus edulis]|uniref:Uncharacterized protein n=1 Tax=Mytilus edulis TaxID=6550 RepID=A0A8S3UYQ8_MYTED|nr:unnamed protein product [Mytilus edulis]
MHYQDHLSKSVLRALKSKRAAKVAYKLLDIFLLFGVEVGNFGYGVRTIAGETLNTFIGQTDDQDSLDQSEKCESSTVQNKRITQHSHEHTAHLIHAEAATERNTKLEDLDHFKKPNRDQTNGKENKMNRSYKHTLFSRTDGSSQMSLSDDEQTQFKPVETLLEKACKAKVSENEYADCIMMDFADKLSFWIDNIHCYATQTEHFELDGGLNPPILVVYRR